MRAAKNNLGHGDQEGSSPKEFFLCQKEYLESVESFWDDIHKK